MDGIVRFSVQIALGIFLPWWVVRSDLRRLGQIELDRSWNDASFWAAIVAFGPLCIPVHFVKARRSFVGLLLGLGWLVAVLGVLSLADFLLGALFG